VKAAVWHGRRDVRIEEVPEPPSPPRGQVKVEVVWCGICGTDLHEYLGGPLYIPVDAPHPLTGARAPVILGHELSGRVVEVGPGVTRVSAGDRVALCPIIGCQKCEWCRSGAMGLCRDIAFLGVSWHGGGFAQYVNVHDYMCYRLPPEVSYEVGALVEPFAATYRAVQRADVEEGTTVAVIGSGPIGLMAIQSACIAGARQVVAFEPAARRQALALRCGASEVVDPLMQDPVAAMRDLTGGAGADIVIECAGIEATGILAGQVARHRGRVVIMGVFELPAPLDYTDLVYGEKTVMGSMGGYGVFEEAIQAMAEGKFNGEPLITDRMGLDDLLKGFDALIEHKEYNVKILVSPVACESLCDQSCL
jgi:(R,R)-butanediol dehydrogenase/meso-butanediol dehydrogenase/diacetyl reductase